MFRIRRIRREKRIRRMRHIRLTRQIRPYPHVPDEILLLLFSHIPLSDLILSVGRVCRDWARNQLEELTRRQTVMIFQEDKQLVKYREQQNPFGSELITRVRRDDGETPWHKLQPLKQIRFNAIRMPAELSEEFTSFLMDILPNIIHLSVAYSIRLQGRDHLTYHSALLTLKQLTRLTNHYTTRLESFSLDFYYDDNAYRDYSYLDDSDDCNDDPEGMQDQFDNSLIALFESINRIGPLRHLMLSGTYPDSKDTRLDLSRLERFVPNDYRQPRVIGDSLMGAPELVNVRVDCNTPLHLGYGCACSAQLAHNCVRFNFYDRFTVDNFDKFSQFCGRFSSLTTLEMGIEYPLTGDLYRPMPMSMVARCLTQLPELIHLILNARFIPQEERTPQLPLAQVPSVRLLSLTMCSWSHSDTQRLHVAQIFPNLQVLDLNCDFDKCGECGYGLKVSNSNRRVACPADIIDRNCPTVGTDANASKLSGRALYEYCARHALEPLRRCANVHTVKLNLTLHYKTYAIKFLTKRAHQWRILPVDEQL